MNEIAKLYSYDALLLQIAEFFNAGKSPVSPTATLMSFIRNAWSNRASEASVADIERVRCKYGSGKKTFTMEELVK